MRKIAVIAVVLCACATACNETDTKSGNVWGSRPCDEPILSLEEAREVLARQPECTDQAIRALEALARTSAVAMNDLAAAYATRAKRDDRPADYLKAFDASEEVLAALPTREARANHDRILEALGLGTRDTTSRWPQAQQQLEAALASGDRQKVMTIVDAFPAAALWYFEAKPEPLLGEALSVRLGGGPAPLRLKAEYDSARIDFSQRRMPDLTSLEREARGYRHFHARVLTLRGMVRTYQSRYLEAFEDWDVAAAEFSHLRDHENFMITAIRRVGAIRAAGQYDHAWRESLELVRSIDQLTRLGDRHLLLGETAATALALRHPRAALAYQNAAIREVQHDKAQLGIALRSRAAIELHLDRRDAALRDLNEAIRLTTDEKGAFRQNGLQARIEEVRGQTLLETQPAEAVAAFTNALTLTTAKEFTTYRAELFSQRAEAFRRAGRAAEAEQDFRTALDLLRREEATNLEHRSAGAGEELWSSYFSRFQDTYRRLIAQLVDQRRQSDAFAYAERARAYEPLNLILQRNDVPADIRELAKDIRPERIQPYLPPGTFLLEYSVHEERTYIWILSRDRFELVIQPVPAKTIERWSDALHRAVQHHDAVAFDLALYAPYEQLLAQPLALIAKNNPQRLVIIPDGAMYSLPISALRNSRTRHYLIEDLPVTTAGSAMLYVVSLRRDAEFPQNGHPSIFLVGDPAFDAPTLSHGLKRLPNARIEVQEIADLYPGAATVRIDTEATVAEFLRLAGKHTIVHIAAHGIPNPETPTRSMLLLARSESDSGVLDAQQLLTQLKLDQTRLVVLSTCSSTDGLSVGPEGVAPLVRPLIAAGVPAVIGSLWDVEDATTRPLLVSFHRHYRQGSDAVVAMQQAQLELLRNKNPGLQSVLTWAPFQVIGHASSPHAPTPHNSGGTPLGIHRTHSVQRSDRLRSQS